MQQFNQLFRYPVKHNIKPGKPELAGSENRYKNPYAQLYCRRQFYKQSISFRALKCEAEMCIG